MDLKEIEKVVASIRSSLFKNSNSFSVGVLRSHFRGAGLQFKEHQVYAPGDDVRFIDWKLSAKSDNTFVKTFEEERNVEILVVLDISPSMLTGFKGISKLQCSIEIACLLFLIAEQSKDKVKVVIILDKVTILPSHSGREGIVLLVSMLQRFGLLDLKGKVNLKFDFPKLVEEKKRLGILKSFVARGKEVVFLSDFSEIDDTSTLNKLVYRRNMHCFKVISPIDEVDKYPFSVLSLVFGQKKLVTTQMKQEKDVIERFKKINVSERYLENFVKEML